MAAAPSIAPSPMTAEQQYLDLFAAQRSVIDAKGAPVLNARRDAAAATLRRLGLGKRAKDFTPTDPAQLLAADYALNLERFEVPTSPADLFTCGIPDLSTRLYYLINEQYVRSRTPQAEDCLDAPEPYYAGSLRQFALTHPDLAEQYYDRLAAQDHTAPTHGRGRRESTCSPGESALNTMFCQDGFVLYVPAGTVLERPFQLISLMRSMDDFMACQRLLIIIGEGARASLLVCDHASELADTALLSLQVTEVFVGRGATFDFYALEEHHSRVRRLSQVYVHQDEGSNTSVGQFALTAGITRNRVHIDLAGQHAETHLFGMVIADGTQQVDNLTFIDHRHPHGTSHELFKYVLDDEARGGFVGRILVRDGAVKTDAHQTDRNLCLSPRARMLARPELEIYADDVKCSHGATVGQLDPQALFYMRTRGISESEARMLLMFAFMGDVIEQIRIAPLRDRLRHLVEKRFRGELTAAGCKGCKGAVPRPAAPDAPDAPAAPASPDASATPDASAPHT